MIVGWLLVIMVLPITLGLWWVNGNLVGELTSAKLQAHLERGDRQTCQTDLGKLEFKWQANKWRLQR